MDLNQEENHVEEENKIQEDKIQKKNDKNNKNGKKRQKFTAVDRLLLVLAIGLLLAAAVLLLWTPWQNRQREEKSQDILQQVEQGVETIVVKRDELEINGEAFENLYEGDEDLSVEMPNVELPEDVVLTSLGIIEIPKIDSKLVLWNDAGLVPLRYGAGHYSDSILPGQPGNSVILGHRMKDYGSIFNRLGEVALDDDIIITMVTGDNKGTSYTYKVTEIIPKLNPSKLNDYVMADSGSGTQLTLVTCTPVGVGTHRLIIIAHMVETNDVNIK